MRLRQLTTQSQEAQVNTSKISIKIDVLLHRFRKLWLKQEISITVNYFYIEKRPKLCAIVMY